MEQRIDTVFEIIRSVTGIERAAIASGSRRRDIYFARMMAARNLYDLGITQHAISGLVGARGPSGVCHQLRGYDRERMPQFRDQALQVAQTLKLLM